MCATTFWNFYWAAIKKSLKDFEQRNFRIKITVLGHHLDGEQAYGPPDRWLAVTLAYKRRQLVDPTHDPPQEIWLPFLGLVIL